MQYEEPCPFPPGQDPYDSVCDNKKLHLSFASLIKENEIRKEKKKSFFFVVDRSILQGLLPGILATAGVILTTEEGGVG